MFCSSRRVFATAIPLLLHNSRVMLVSYNSSKSMVDWENSNYVVEPISQTNVESISSSNHGYLHAERSSPISLSYDRNVAHAIPKLNKPLPVATSETRASTQEQRQQQIPSRLFYNKAHNHKHGTGQTSTEFDNDEQNPEFEEQQQEEHEERYSVKHIKKKSYNNNDNYSDLLEWEENDDKSSNESDTLSNYNSNNSEDEENYNKHGKKVLHTKTKRGSSSTGKGSNNNNNNSNNDNSDDDEELRDDNKHSNDDVNNGLITPPRAPRTLILKHKLASSSTTPNQINQLHESKADNLAQNTKIASRVHRGTSENTYHKNTTKLKSENDTTLTMSSSSSESPSSSVELNITQNIKSTSSNPATNTLTNPFRGLHERIARSYRLDPLMTGSTGNDILLARQERRSTAFSFLKFQASQAFYEGHWNSLQDLQQQQKQLWESTNSNSAKISSISHNKQLQVEQRKKSKNTVDEKCGLPTNQFTLFNNNLGLDSWWIHSNYALIVAQRLLLFPDHMRHFHTICGRDNIPCDFFADVDLPDETEANGEQILLEILNYLEVRLPGVGFTDPFFLVLTNEEPSKDKVSYHIHARSMTYAKDYYTAMSTLLNNDRNADADSVSDNDEAKESFDGNDISSNDDKMKAVKKANKEKSKNVTTKNKSRPQKKETKNQIIAFQDYKTVKLIVEEINQTVGRAVIDESCYRSSGMLRCAFSAKLHSNQEANYRNAVNNPKRRLVPLLKAKDSALQSKLNVMEQVLRTMTDPEILEMTFCTRFINEPAIARFVHDHLKKVLPEVSSTDLSMPSLSSSFEQKEREYSAILRASSRHSFKLIKPRHILGPQTNQVQEYDNYGNAVSPYLCEAAKWRRYRMVVEKLHTLPPRVAEQYDTWVRIGLALHNFSNEDYVFEEWVRFSLKCPMKYSREVCKRKWIQFERNPDAQNWRRGFNYLNACIWREV